MFVFSYLSYFSFFFPANIALNKTTYMSSTFSNFTSSNKAVDGQKTDLSYSGGQCAISKHGYKTVEWRVDLENLSSISNITIYFRTENSPWGNQMNLNVYQWVIKKFQISPCLHLFNIEPQNVIKDEITQSLFEKLKRIHNIKMCSLEHSDLDYRLLIMKWVL